LVRSWELLGLTPRGTPTEGAPGITFGVFCDRAALPVKSRRASVIGMDFISYLLIVADYSIFGRELSSRKRISGATSFLKIAAGKC